jgi:hypothetical protein
MGETRKQRSEVLMHDVESVVTRRTCRSLLPRIARRRRA